MPSRGSDDPGAGPSPDAEASTPVRGATHPEHEAPTSLAALARLFLTLGTVAFGGPAAHIAMMEDEVVTRRRWMSRAQFLDLLGATNLIPGPNSTELAIHIGFMRAGWPGLFVAGASFILPAALIVAAVAWAYVRFGALPQADGLLYGIKPVVIAVVLQALWRLGRSAVTSRFLAVLVVMAAAANIAGLGEIAVLLVAGVVAALVRGRGAPHVAANDDATIDHATIDHTTMDAASTEATNDAGGSTIDDHHSPVLAPWLVPAGATSLGGATAVGLWPLFLFFAKVGAVLFGSGYVLLAFLRSGLVVERGWLSEAQLLDAVAIGQVTPGPVFTTATFIGYLLAGGAGAAVATLGIFLPAFAFVAISGPLVPRLRASRVAGAVFDGVNAASLALMAVVTARLGVAALVDVPTLLLAVASAALLYRWRVNSAWLVLGGALAGLALRAAGVTG